MALADYASKDGDGKGKSPAVAVHVESMHLEPVAAMTKLMKAIHANDAHAAYDAFCLLNAAHEDKYGEDGEPDGDE